jgi:hypothetical protein
LILGGGLMMDSGTYMEAHSKGLALGLAAGDERNRELRVELEEKDSIITAYQIAKDNLELRLKLSQYEEEWQDDADVIEVCAPEQVY